MNAEARLVPWQAELLDAAAGVFIRFRLGGVSVLNHLPATRMWRQRPTCYTMLSSDHFPSRHLLQDLHPPSHHRCVCQQPKGLHPAGPQEACGLAERQEPACVAGGPVRVVPAYREQQLEAVLQQGEEHVRDTCLFAIHIVISEMSLTRYSYDRHQQVAVYPCQTKAV